MIHAHSCLKCQRQTASETNFCMECEFREHENLRAFHERVFLAAVTGLLSKDGYDPDNSVADANVTALTALRQYPQIAAERDDAIRQIVEG